MVKAKAEAANVRVPQSREEAAAMISEFGAALREIELIETTLNDTLQKAKASAEAEATPFKKTADDLFAGLKLYCEANRTTLLGNSGIKTHDFGTGKVAWRFRPSKVTISGGAEAVVEKIDGKMKAAIERGETGENYKNFLRVTVEINKEAMLANPDLARTIDGVRIGRSGEVFEVEPFGAQLAEAV